MPHFDRFAATDRSHAPRGNASRDALRHQQKAGRRAPPAAFPRAAWKRSACVAQALSPWPHAQSQTQPRSGSPASTPGG
ncbi:hypothetical protein FJ692_00600 [Pseudomonas fluorescens]|nr:hypothetical protein C1751_14040 [Pseudomonas fluorescens]TPV61275.1 hypothetical protein FJ692_00600 [Pseudomonas fluorescens]